MVIFIGIVIGIIGLIVIGFLKKKPTNQEKELFSVKTTSKGNNHSEITTEINKDEFLKRAKNGTLNNGKPYQKTIKDIAGFYGIEKKSPNKKYSVYFCDGMYNGSKWKNGNLALILDDKLLFKKEIERPNDCKVNDNGTVACCDWLDSDELIGKFYIFDKFGSELFSRKTKANLGNCELSNDSEIAIFETHNAENNDGDKLFIIDLQANKIKKKIDRPVSFNKAVIDTKNQRIKLNGPDGFDYEIDFNGKQTNIKEYEKQILEKGSVYDILYYCESKPDEVKFNDENYLSTLKKAINDKDASYSFGLDSIYRKIGEYHEKKNDIAKTIEYWEKSIELNPKVGVKRKLNLYKTAEK